MTEELETFGFCFVESKKLSFSGLHFPRPNFRRGKCWSFRGHCFHHHFRSQRGHRFHSFQRRSQSHRSHFLFHLPHWNLTEFSVFTARRVFRSVLEVKPAGSPILLPATSPCRVWDINFVLFVHKPRQNVCSTRDPDSPRRPPFCYAKNAWLCVSVVHAEKILVI